MGGVRKTRGCSWAGCTGYAGPLGSGDPAPLGGEGTGLGEAEAGAETRDAGWPVGVSVKETLGSVACVAEQTLRLLPEPHFTAL